MKGLLGRLGVAVFAVVIMVPMLASAQTTGTALSACSFTNPNNPSITELQNCVQVLTQILTNLVSQIGRLGTHQPASTVALSTLSPSAGPIGTPVTISGSGFSPTSNLVKFGNYSAGNFSSADGSTLSFNVPSYLAPVCAAGQMCAQYVVPVQSGNYNVSVSNVNGTSNILPFAVVSGVTAPTSTSDSITVVYPNGGEVFDDSGAKTNIANIQWTSSNMGSLTVSIYLVDANGNYVKPIALGIPNSGSYMWASDPSLPNGNYKIDISSNDKGPSAADNSNGFFQIVNSPLGTTSNPSIIVEVPQAGTGYQSGGVLSAYWLESGVTPRNVKIYLNGSALVGQATPTLASLGASNQSSYNVTLPNLPSGSDYVLSVCDEGVPSPTAAGKSLCGSSPQFSITAAQVTTVPPSIQISATDGSQTSNTAITAQIGDTFTISGIPQNLSGLSYWYGSGYPPSGYFNRAYFFDQSFSNNNQCGNNSASTNGAWTFTCTAKVPGSTVLYVVIYANGQTYTSNQIAVTIPTQTTQPTPPTFAIQYPKGGESVAQGSSMTVSYATAGSFSTSGGVYFVYLKNGPAQILGATTNPTGESYYPILFRATALPYPLTITIPTAAAGGMWTGNTYLEIDYTDTNGNPITSATSNAFTVAAPTAPTVTPTVSSVSPTSGTTNTSVTLSGANLQGATQVLVYNGSQQVASFAVSSVASDGSSVTFSVGAAFMGMVGPGSYQLKAQTSAGTTNALSFTVTAPVSSSSPFTVTAPTSGTLTQGNQATIQWTTNGGKMTANLSLVQNGTYLTQIASGVSSGSYTWTVPATYSGSGFAIYVSAVGALPATGGTFSIVASTQAPVSSTVVPTVTNFSPASGPTGTQVTITGTGFTPTGNYVNFGGYGIQGLSSTNANTLTFTVPPVGAGNYQVYVATNWGQSTPSNFTVTPPVMSSGSPFTVTAPVSGTLTQGNQATIQWTSASGAPSSVNLNLVQANGAGSNYLYQIASGVPNNGSYLWTVPSNYSGSGFAIYVSAVGALPSTGSAFSITAVSATSATGTQSLNIQTLSQTADILQSMKGILQNLNQLVR